MRCAAAPARRRKNRDCFFKKTDKRLTLKQVYCNMIIQTQVQPFPDGNGCVLIFFAPVAQLDRVSDSDSDGCRFDPCRVHHLQATAIRSYLVCKHPKGD